MDTLAVLRDPKGLLALLKETFNDWSEDKAANLAAALAYYTAFSIAPLLLISIVVAGLFFGREAAQGQIFGQLEGLLGPEAAGVIQTSVANSQQSGASTLSAIIGVVTLIWSASSLFAQLQDALNTIWEVKPDPRAGWLAFIKRRFLSMTLVLGIAFVLLVSLVLSAGLAAVGGLLGNVLPGGNVFWQAVNFVISFALVTGLFAAIYKVLPDATINWSDVWIGAAFTAFLFTAGKLVIGLYLGHASIGSTFGAAGSLLVFLVWVYYSAQILFFGAEFTQVYARKYGSRIVPAPGAVALDPQDRAQQGIPHENTAPKHAAARERQEALAGAGAGSRRENGKAVAPDGRPNGRPNARANGSAYRRGAARAPGDYATTKHAQAHLRRGAGGPAPGGSGGSNGAPGAVKKLLWAGLVSGSLAVGAVAARRASAEIWRGVFHQEPPTRNV
ncbi:MAG: YihY family inner membrane protein [Chloroflexi bacterium]|nr:YihY family inner membrane protein [Chloroflexota bacterium]